MAEDSPAELGKIIREEVELAVQSAADAFIANFTPGLALQPLSTIAAVISTAGQEFFFDLTRNVKRLPAKIASRLALASITQEDSTRVCTLKDAKTFAASLVANAVWELSGGGPPTIAKITERASRIKGLRSRLIAREEAQILGPVLKRILAVVRAPVVFALRLGLVVWDLFVAVLAIGAACALWNVVKSDWSSVALSQKHPRKWKRERVYKRL